MYDNGTTPIQHVLFPELDLREDAQSVTHTQQQPGHTTLHKVVAEDFDDKALPSADGHL